MPAAPPQPDRPWLICIDTGGTFTDCLARDPSGAIHRAKVLSTSALRGRVKRVSENREIEIEQAWGAADDLIAGFDVRRVDSGEMIGRVASFHAAKSLLVMERGGADSRRRLEPGTLIEVQSDEPAPVLAARLVTQTPAGQALPPMHIRLATTRGTNALLERKGAKMALFITEGFGDLLRIGDQSRPDIFALRIVKPEPLHEHVVEVAERLNADGSVLRPLHEERVRSAALRLREVPGVNVAAVALLHSHVNPAHEQRVAAILRECGFEHVSVSSEIAPLIRIVPRAQTAVVDAYLGPIIGDYLRMVATSSGPNCRLHVMSSAGSLSDASRFRACESLLSGPAGGVLGMAAAGRASGFTRVIGFDMGGTSTDVCRVDGELDYRFEHSVGDVKLLAPALAIETVAAGGGSICDFVDGRLKVGPESAGANPGPACYGGGGPLTLTDVNLLLGRLSAEQFEIPVAVEAARAALQELLRGIEKDTCAKPQAAEMLSGFLEIANQRMAAAIEEVSLRQGYDVRDYALVAFGGAGGQHACDLANRLRIQTIIMPADASLMSAAGLMSAAIERFAQRQVLCTIDECRDELVEMIHALARQAVAAVAAEGVVRETIDVRRVIANVRMLGQDSTLQVEILVDEGDDIAGLLRQKFAARYEQIYGHAPPLERKPIELESMRVVAWAKGDDDQQDEEAAEQTGEYEATSQRNVRAYLGGAWRDVPAFDRSELRPGAAFDGPALVFDRRTSYLIDAGWRAKLDRAGSIILTRGTGAVESSRMVQPEIVRLELFANRFMAIAREMGQMLERTALSTNVKERLDFSCTLLDAEGQLIANAPHLPVHLGAMGVCVRRVREAIAMRPGDVVVTNHPAFGGSHLPDITVITPVFDEGERGGLLGYVANRAHHAEVGGVRPGSMPPNATTLAEEGVVIPPMHLMRRGKPEWEAVEKLLSESPYPSRAVADNLADLQAQVAANHRGAEALRNLAQQHGRDEIARQMQALTDRATRLAAAAFDRLPRRAMEAGERLDDGSPLHVRIDLTQRPVVIDFAGTAPQHSGNLNATPAIVRSAVIYVLRLLVGERLPLNEGLMREVDVQIPRGSMLDPIFDPHDPAQCPAVVGGNVETSQRLVDTLIKALGIAACSQGTMNNTLFGNERFGYYETVCGGSGATSGGAGADAVHTHMTNTRITDPEIIEHRYPVRIERFAIRRGSGGNGQHHGGDGAIREITFLQPMSLSLLTQHRIEQPFGMEGGEAGACGRQRLLRAGNQGDAVDLKSIDGCEVRAGDRLVLETPGGGGWGRAGTDRE
jgi:5-oxoprolinase (ATP-hydrolysing)